MRGLEELYHGKQLAPHFTIRNVQDTNMVRQEPAQQLSR